MFRVCPVCPRNNVCRPLRLCHWFIGNKWIMLISTWIKSIFFRRVQSKSLPRNSGCATRKQKLLITFFIAPEPHTRFYSSSSFCENSSSWIRSANTVENLSMRFGVLLFVHVPVQASWMKLFTNAWSDGPKCALIIIIDLREQKSTKQKINCNKKTAVKIL